MLSPVFWYHKLLIPARNRKKIPWLSSIYLELETIRSQRRSLFNMSTVMLYVAHKPILLRACIFLRTLSSLYPPIYFQIFLTFFRFCTQTSNTFCHIYSCTSEHRTRKAGALQGPWLCWVLPKGALTGKQGLSYCWRMHLPPSGTYCHLRGQRTCWIALEALTPSRLMGHTDLSIKARAMSWSLVQGRWSPQWPPKMTRWFQS